MKRKCLSQDSADYALSRKSSRSDNLDKPRDVEGLEPQRKGETVVWNRNEGWLWNVISKDEVVQSQALTLKPLVMKIINYP